MVFECVIIIKSDIIFPFLTDSDIITRSETERYILKTIKIMHAGDVHLDSAFMGIDSRYSEIRRREILAAFTSMMTYAKMNSVDLMLIAGDLFENTYVTNETLIIAKREFEKFGKPIFVSPGNHDHIRPDSVWMKYKFPSNVYVFREPQLTSYKLDELPVTVYGYAFTDKKKDDVPIEGKKVEDPERINLLVGHCDIISPVKPRKNHCPIRPYHFDAFGADYAALGHIHNPPPNGHDNRFCYSGCLEPRGFDEIGPKGACLVEIEKDGVDSTVTVKRVRFSKRTYEEAEISVTGAETQSDISNAVSAYISANHYGENTLLSVNLTGFISPSLVIDRDSLEFSKLGLFYLRVEDLTRPDLDLTVLEKDPTIKGEVYRKLKPSLEADDKRTREVALRALRYSLSALYGDRTF